VNNREAAVVSPTADRAWYQRFADVCPTMFNQRDGDLKICCTLHQVNTLKDQLTASLLLFERCPSCMENFRNLYCQVNTKLVKLSSFAVPDKQLHL